LSEGRFDFLKEFVKTVPDLIGDTDDIPGSSSSTTMEEPCPPPLELPKLVYNNIRIKKMSKNGSEHIRQKVFV
jgi:hypothetical protein